MNSPANHNNGKYRKTLSLFVRLLFIGNIMLGSVAFSSYLEWYDTGTLNHDGWHIVAIGGIINGILALMGEIYLYKRQKFWPKNRVLFFVRMIALSIMYVTLSFSVSSGVYYVIHELLEGAGFFSSVTALLLSPILAAFYLTMIFPFGIAVGLVNGFLLRLSFTLSPE